MSDQDYQLPSKAGVDAAQAVLKHALDLADGARLNLDASGVDSIDGPAVITLAGVARAQAESGAPIRVKSPSSPFVDAFSDLGLFEDLMKMEFQS